MKCLALAAALCLALAAVGHGQQNPADTPASNMMKKQMHQMVHDFVQKQSKLPSDFEASMDKMMDNMWNDLPIDEVLQAEIPVYQKHFTKGDIDALVAFYSTPT